ncbi:unannotated protein [freshwater metagenome]|uniref:Unannotated protein n=1 Tax=freshwater metagenome TaxID=449393 RepID=A0A6J7DQI5_9ZZZZ|nr:hypothetical protein [Actinomycetota bacterium]
MLHPDPRAYRVALLADAIANESAASFDALGMLDAANFGVVVLPPADFAISTIASIVEYTIDDLVDYRASGYRVVVVGTSAVAQFGVWIDHVHAEIERRAIDPFEVFDIVGATGESFQRFLDASVPSALMGH